MYSNELGLIGGENFALDGLRLPSNALIDMSGTEKQLKKRLAAYCRMAVKHLERHKRKDIEDTSVDFVRKGECKLPIVTLLHGSQFE